jgi:hypothetical protein
MLGDHDAADELMLPLEERKTSLWLLGPIQPGTRCDGDLPEPPEDVSRCRVVLSKHVLASHTTPLFSSGTVIRPFAATPEKVSAMKGGAMERRGLRDKSDDGVVGFDAVIC